MKCDWAWVLQTSEIVCLTNFAIYSISLYFYGARVMNLGLEYLSEFLFNTQEVKNDAFS